MKASFPEIEGIRFHKRVNAMEQSAEKSPYIGQIVSAGTVDTDQFIDEMISKGCTESAEAIRRVIASGDNVLKECVGENVLKVYTGDGSLVTPHIYGSFDAPDAPAGADNAVEPNIRLGAELRDCLADIVPEEDRSGIADLGGVRILSVLTEGVGFSLVKGTLPFSIAGMGFKPSATATQTVKAKNLKTGVETAATVVEVDSTQRITAKFATALSAGNYQLVVTVTEDEEGKVPRSATYNVKTLAE